MRATRDESSEMRHVDEVDRVHLVGNLAHAREVDDAWIGAAPADDQLGTLALGKLLQFVVVDGLGLARNAVRNDLVGLAGEVQRMTMREVAAVSQVQAQYGVAWLDDRGVRGHVRG